METSQNRFRIEEEPVEEEWRGPVEAKEESFTKNRKSRWPLFLGIFTIFLVLGSLGYASYVFYFKKKTDMANIAEAVQELPKDKKPLELLLDKPYLPDGRLGAGIAKCLQLYKERYNTKAFQVCEEFLNTPGTDEDKSLALTVIGIMFDESGRGLSSIERLTKAIQYDPKNFYAFYNLALAYKHQGKWEEAKKAALRAKDLAPNDPRVALLNGNLFSAIGDADLAVEAFKEGQSQNPDDPTLAYNLAMSYYRQGNLPKAIEEFEKSAIKAPTSPIAVLAYGHLGAIYYSREDYDRAEFYFRDAVRLKPNDAKYHYNLGLVLWKKNNVEEALRSFQRSLDSGGSDPEVFRSIADAFVTLGKPSLATQALKKGLALQPNNIDLMFPLAEIYYQKGELVEAENSFKNIIRVTPGDKFTETAYVNLGIILDEMQRHSEAIRAFGSALELNPKNQSAYYNLGLAYLHQGSPSLAIENFRKSASLAPDHLASRMAIAEYYLGAGFFIEATQELEKIIGEKPNLHDARLKLADSYYKLKSFTASEKQLIYVLENSKDAKEIKIAHRMLALVYANSGTANRKAKEEAFRASHMDPNDMDSKLVLAKILIDSGSLLDREKALEELEIIVRSEATPTILAKAFNYRGVCFFKNGEYKRAIQEFQSAVDLDPNYTEAYNNKRSARAQWENSLESRRRAEF